MSAADRLPAIIAAMVEVATRGTRGAADTLAPDHDLAAALSGAVDLAEVAPLLPLSGVDHQHAAGLLRIVAGRTTEPLAEADRVLACRVAARLASSAALLLALDADAFAGAAGLLWRAAGCMCGLETAPGMTDLMVSPEAIDEVLADAPVPVSSLKVGDRVLLLGTVEDISGADGIPVRVSLDGDRFGDVWTELRAENVVYRATDRESEVEPKGYTVPTIGELRDRYAASADAVREAAALREADLSAHLAAADKRARDTAAECVRLYAELDKARKEAAGWHRLVQETSHTLASAGCHGDNVVKQAGMAAHNLQSMRDAIAAVEAERDEARKDADGWHDASKIYLDERNRFASEAQRLRHSIATIREAAGPA